MHHPLTDIQADFEMNRPTSTIDIKLPQKKLLTQTSRTTTIHVGSFFKKKENTTKIEKKILKINYFSHASS